MPIQDSLVKLDAASEALIKSVKVNEEILDTVKGRLDAQDETVRSLQDATSGLVGRVDNQEGKIESEIQRATDAEANLASGQTQISDALSQFAEITNERLENVEKRPADSATVKVLKRDVENLKAMAEGTIYTTITDDRKAVSKTIGDAELCGSGASVAPHGVLEMVGGDTREIIIQGINLVNFDSFMSAYGATKDSDGFWTTETIFKENEDTSIIFTNTGEKSGSIYYRFTPKNVSTRTFFLKIIYIDGTTFSTYYWVDDKVYKSYVLSNPQKTVKEIRCSYGSLGTVEIKDLVISWMPPVIAPYHVETKILPYNLTEMPYYGASAGDAYNHLLFDTAAHRVWYRQEVYEDADGVMRELDTHITYDVTHLFPDDFADIEIETGGTVTFKTNSELNIPVPSIISYLNKIGG